MIGDLVPKLNDLCTEFRTELSSELKRRDDEITRVGNTAREEIARLDKAMKAKPESTRTVIERDEHGRVKAIVNAT